MRTKKRLVEMIRKVIKTELNRNRLTESKKEWSYVTDGRAELAGPNGEYYVCKADENNVFEYSISIHKRDNSIQYLKKNIDGERRLNQELVNLGLPKVDERVYHEKVSVWYDSMEDWDWM